MKIDIIGGGVAGMALGIYLQKQGHRTTIYENHHQAGGLCTGWRRGDYTFNGCLHWLLGTQAGISFYHFWKEITDIDAMEFEYFDERTATTIAEADNTGSHTFHFYNDIDRLEEYLLRIAPEDSRPIKEWTDAVRFIVPYLDYLPPVINYTDPLWRRWLFKMSLMRLLPVGLFMKKWAKTSNRSFARRFQNPFVRSAIEHLYDNEMRMTVVFFAQAYAHKRVAGYPLGGSLAFADRLRKSYEQAGGELRLSTRVTEIVVENDRAVGVRLASGETTRADYVASCADWHTTVFGFLGGKYLTPAMAKLKQPKHDDVFYSFCMLHMGIAVDLSHLPHFSRFPIEHLTSPDGTEYDQIEVHVYNYDPLLAPKGKTTMSINLTTRNGQWWIDLRKSDIEEYRRQKQALTDKMLACISERYGDVVMQNIEVCELATPATYHRYTGNMRGSSQGWTPQQDITKRIAVRSTLPGLEGFVMAGQWVEAGGGVPVALITARRAAEEVRKNGK